MFKFLAQSLSARLGRMLQLHIDERTDYLQARIDQLERLLTEHPEVASKGMGASGLGSPAVSVILPTWNRARVVCDAIRSIQAQRFTDWELIVVDDGSTDDTAAAVGGFLADARIRFAAKDHAGQAAARNHGLSLAKGALIAYQDSDNLWYPDFLAAAVTAFVADPALEIGYGALVSEVHRKDRRLLFEPFDRERLLKANFIAMTTLIHRRRLFDELGGFDESLGTHEDWDLILRYTQAGPAVPLAVLASRCRVVDGQRVSTTRRPKADFVKITRKWK